MGEGREELMNKAHRLPDTFHEDHIHTTRDGQQIPLRQLTDGHLLNILRYQHRKAEEGLVVGSGWGGDMYADELYGEEVLQKLNHNLYVCEAFRRDLKLPCGCRCKGAEEEFFGMAQWRLKEG